MKKMLFIVLLFSSFQSQAQKVYDQFDDFQQEVLLNYDPDTTYVINFWATWCRPCVQELPYFDSLHVKYEGQKVKVILVSLDAEDRIETNLRPFLARKNIQADVVVLTAGKQNDWIDLVDPRWSGAIPITLLIKGENKEFYEKSYHTFEELEKDLLNIHLKTE